MHLFLLFMRSWLWDCFPENEYFSVSCRVPPTLHHSITITLSPGDLAFGMSTLGKFFFEEGGFYAKYLFLQGSVGPHPAGHIDPSLSTQLGSATCRQTPSDFSLEAQRANTGHIMVLSKHCGY